MVPWLAAVIASIRMLDKRCGFVTQDLIDAPYQLHAMNNDPVVCVPELAYVKVVLRLAAAPIPPQPPEGAPS
jgi:hypothetical protein